MSAGRRPVIAIMASGSGTTFRATADAVHEGLVDFDIGLVITDRENAGVLEQAAEVNRLYGFRIKTAIINKKLFPNGVQGRGQTREEAEAIIKLLKEHHIDHVALMGYMRIVAPQLIEQYGWKSEFGRGDSKYHGMYRARMSNTHPGILPATVDTYGIRTQEKVLELSLPETAQTFHVVAAGVDEGPTIAEHRVPVFAAPKYPKDAADTPEKLFARVQRVEKAHLPLDLDAFLKMQANFNSSTEFAMS